MNVIFKSNNVELINFNGLIRRQLKEYFDQYENVLTLETLVYDLADYIDDLKIENYCKYKNLLSLICVDCYTYLNQLEINMLANNIELEIFQIIKNITDINIIDDFLLEKMIKIEYKFLSLNELSKKTCFLNLGIGDNAKLYDLNKLHFLDILEYNTDTNLDDFYNLYEELSNDELGETIIVTIKNYLQSLSKRYPELYKKNINELLLYAYKWCKYIVDNSYVVDISSVEKVISNMFENNIDDIIKNINKNDDLLGELIDICIYYKIEQKDVIIDKKQDRVEFTSEDVEKYYQKIKKD